MPEKKLVQINFPKILLRELDSWWKGRYPDRSEFIRQAVREKLNHEKKKEEK